MVSDAKIDPQVQQQMQAPGAAASTAIPVLVEMEDQPSPPPALDRGAEMESLQRGASEATGGVVQQLKGFGLRDDEITTLALVNAVAARLTPEQITTVARRADVRFIRYNGEANVAL